MTPKSELTRIENMIEHYEAQVQIPKIGIARRIDENALAFYKAEREKIIGDNQ
jgi:hypothetical protein